MRRSFLRPLRVYARRLIHSRVSAHEIAFGISLGIFVSVVTPYFTHIFVALGLAWLFRVNKIAAGLGTMFNNPLTLGPIYVGAFELGSFICGTDLTRLGRDFSFSGFQMNAEFWQKLRLLWATHGSSCAFSLGVGLFIVATVSAALGYVVARMCINYLRTKQSDQDEFNC